MGTFGLVLIIAVLVAMGLSLIVVLAFVLQKSVILKLEKRNNIELVKAAVDAEERLKTKIASHLHDGVLPLLAMLNRNLDFKDPDRFSTEQELVNQTILEVKSASLDLMPNVLVNLGLLKAIERYIRYMQKLDEGSVDLQIDDVLGGGVGISTNNEIHIYRMCVEILTNLKKHAHYSYLLITISKDDNTLSFDFRHDGTGVTNSDIEKFTSITEGLGLKSLKTRSIILNARIDYYIQDVTAGVKLKIPIP